MVNQLKSSHYPHTSQPYYPIFLTKNKKERLPTHGSYLYIYIYIYKLPTVSIKKKKKNFHKKFIKKTTHIT